MPRKARSATPKAKRVSPRAPAAKPVRTEDPEADDLSALVLRACLIARDSVFNVRDYFSGKSRMALLAITDCEKELDQIERKIDDELPGAITRVGENKARQLLACLKFITDLERIGDLAYSAVMQLQARREELPAQDSRDLAEMAVLLHDMVEQVYKGFQARDIECARRVLQSDPEVDRLCHTLFQRHLAESENTRNFDILLTAQALERIGDHTKNLAEELYGLVERRSLRHTARKLSSA